MEQLRIRLKSNGPAKRYSEAFKKQVVQEFEKGLLNKDQLQSKYGIAGKSRVLEWCRKYGKFAYNIPTQNGRPMKDPQKQRIKELEKKLKAYVYEAIEAERAGLKVKLKKTSEFRVPEEFQKRLDKSTALKKAFDALTPGRQRAYIFYFSQAKQSKTREARVEKYIKQILSGKGLDD